MTEFKLNDLNWSVAHQLLPFCNAEDAQQTVEHVKAPNVQGIGHLGAIFVAFFRCPWLAQLAQFANPLCKMRLGSNLQGDV